MFDTHRLLQELDYDEYIEGSIQLYLDIINLFLYILRVRAHLQFYHQRRTIIVSVVSF